MALSNEDKKDVQHAMGSKMADKVTKVTHDRAREKKEYIARKMSKPKKEKRYADSWIEEHKNNPETWGS